MLTRPCIHLLASHDAAVAWPLSHRRYTGTPVPTYSGKPWSSTMGASCAAAHPATAAFTTMCTWKTGNPESLLVSALYLITGHDYRWANHLWKLLFSMSVDLRVTSQVVFFLSSKKTWRAIYLTWGSLGQTTDSDQSGQVNPRRAGRPRCDGQGQRVPPATHPVAGARRASLWRFHIPYVCAWTPKPQAPPQPSLPVTTLYGNLLSCQTETQGSSLPHPGPHPPPCHSIQFCPFCPFSSSPRPPFSLLLP